MNRSNYKKIKLYTMCPLYHVIKLLPIQKRFNKDSYQNANFENVTQFWRLNEAGKT